MVVWEKPLYSSESVKKREPKIIRAIERRRPVHQVTVIAFASNPENLFDLLDANELLKPYYKNREIHILGLADGIEDAKELVCRIVEEIVQETDTGYIKEYFAAVRCRLKAPAK